MKKRLIILTIAALISVSACSNANGNSEIIQTEVQEDYQSTSQESDDDNRAMIAEALGVEKDSRNIRFILNGINTVGMGRLQSARMLESDGQKILSLVAEDGTEYQMYLSESGNMEAVQNLDTGEWPIQSEQ